MIKFSKVIFLFLMFTIVVSGCGRKDLREEFSQKKIKLELKFTQGEIQHYDFTQKMEVETSLLGASFALPAENQFGISQNVEEVIGKAARIRQKIEYFQQDAAILEATSKDISREIVGTEINFTILPSGKIRQLKKSSELQDLLDDGFDYDQVLETFYGFLPASPVMLGDKWKNQNVLSFPTKFGHVELSQDIEYHLVDAVVKNGYQCLKIEMDGEIAVDVEMTNEQVLPDVSSSGMGKLEGYIYFDPGEGMVIFSQQDMELEIATQLSSLGNSFLDDFIKGSQIKLNNKIEMQLRREN